MNHGSLSPPPPPPGAFGRFFYAAKVRQPPPAAAGRRRLPADHGTLQDRTDGFSGPRREIVPVKGFERGKWHGNASGTGPGTENRNVYEKKDRNRGLI